MRSQNSRIPQQATLGAPLPNRHHVPPHRSAPPGSRTGESSARALTTYPPLLRRFFVSSRKHDIIIIIFVYLELKFSGGWWLYRISAYNWVDVAPKCARIFVTYVVNCNCNWSSTRLNLAALHMFQFVLGWTVVREHEFWTQFSCARPQKDMRLRIRMDSRKFAAAVEHWCRGIWGDVFSRQHAWEKKCPVWHHQRTSVGDASALTWTSFLDMQWSRSTRG